MIPHHAGDFPFSPVEDGAHLVIALGGITAVPRVFLEALLRLGRQRIMARHFLKPESSLSANAEQALVQHKWPGNVRELQNLMHNPKMSRFSLQGRFIFLLSTILIVTVVTSVLLALYLQEWALVLPVVILISMLFVTSAVKSFFIPVNKTLQALSSGVASFNDHDYSVTISNNREDELGQLVEVYNELASTLRDERFSLFQRELLLDTVIESSAVAVVIANHRGSIVYANREASTLLGEEDRIEGGLLFELARSKSTIMAESIEARKDGLFSLEAEDEAEVYHLTCRRFNLNAQDHGLFLFKKLTREIARQEVDTWKKVIRVITHELNNSLAPITSLTASARKISASGKSTEKLDDIYQSIGNRANHLQTFIEQYASFARLPQPRIVNVEWSSFVENLHRLIEFNLAENPPEGVVRFDLVQMEQVLINLVKNATESDSAIEDVQLRILQNSNEILIAVEDRGSGMEPEQMKLALLPFYSTKRSGTGLGLPLCREIIEAHGGSLQIMNRKQGGLAAVCKLPVRIE
ncbi:MAG: two-component system nitrogen regulation sensor histidine kinase NtrY [Lysobacterales bacterium]|jgi:two-component system nitrogen regulation sensor histidine kinase NtrY